VAVTCYPPATPVPASATPSNAITNILWQWMSVTSQTTRATTEIPSPQAYTIIFRDDGTLSDQADCNTFTGTYTQECGFFITARPGVMAACGGDSLDQQYFELLDDFGYGQLSCFGGLVETPVIDSLAANGLRYTNMHTTALCSPSRGCILTGRNHHSIGLASITETSTGYPGYNGILPFDRGMISEMLVQKGHNTFCVGKWHLTPPEHTTPAGPYDRWPLGRGFERFYGFLGGETHQWYPELTYDNHEVQQPKQPEEGYHLSIDLADKAIEFIQDAQVNAPDKPFFLYYATGAGHAPHHVPQE
jgi:hypothetical protein